MPRRPDAPTPRPQPRRQVPRLRVEVEELLSAERQAEDLMTKEILSLAKDHPKLSRLLMAERVESAALRSDLEEPPL